MRRWFLCFAGLALSVAIMGCTPERPTAPNNGVTTPQPWQGPKSDVVFSSDNPHCGKSDTARQKGLPGYVRVNWPEGPAVYHSTDGVVSIGSDMVDTGYRLHQMSLWKRQDTNKEVYIASKQENKPARKAVVYELGGCE